VPFCAPPSACQPALGSNVCAAKPPKSISDPKEILWPLVLAPGPRTKLAHHQFQALQETGRILLTDGARRALNNIAQAWISHDAVLHSPRPADFRARLKAMRAPVEKACAETDLLRPNATVLDQHLYHWLFDRNPTDTAVFLQQLGELPAIIEFLERAEKSLSAVNRGTARAMDEGRFIRFLADQFENCGRKASAYATAHTKIGFADTPFRAFIHQFYEFLPLKSKRRRSGLDQAICLALKERRKSRTR
jgi:hypothetical protein